MQKERKRERMDGEENETTLLLASSYLFTYLPEWDENSAKFKRNSEKGAAPKALGRRTWDRGSLVR